MGRYYYSIESYEMAISINGKFASAWYNKANAYASLGIVTKAIEDYKQALAYNRKDVFALYNLANSYEQMGKYKDAIETFTKAVSNDPNHYESFFGRGNCYYQIEDFNKALRDYNRAIELFQDNSELWYAKADAEYNLGKIAESVNSYRIVLSLNPENHQAVLDLANTMIEIEDYSEADELLNKLIDLKSQWSEPYYSKSKLYFLQANIEEGVKHLEMAFVINPEDRFEYDFEKDWEKILQFLIARDN